MMPAAPRQHTPVQRGGRPRPVARRPRRRGRSRPEVVELPLEGGLSCLSGLRDLTHLIPGPPMAGTWPSAPPGQTPLSAIARPFLSPRGCSTERDHRSDGPPGLIDEARLPRLRFQGL